MGHDTMSTWFGIKTEYDKIWKPVVTINSSTLFLISYRFCIHEIS
jgi:hypothetical protein